VDNKQLQKAKTILRCLNEGFDVQNMTLEEEPEASDAPFGKYALDVYRNDIPSDEKESMTPVEREAAYALSSYVTGNAKGKLSGMASILLDLVKKGLYKPILDPSDTDFVYRILVLRDLAKLEAVTGKKIEKEDEEYGLTGPGTLYPIKERVSGWTSDINLIATFSAMGVMGDVFAVFKAPVKGNAFFGKPGVMTGAVDKAFEVEMETIGVGPIEFVECAYASMQQLGGVTLTQQINSTDEARDLVMKLLTGKKVKKAAENTPKTMADTMKEKLPGMFAEEPEQGSKAVFGKYAFDPKRADVPKPEKEKMTPQEIEAFRAIDAYVAGNNKSGLDKAAPMLLQLVKQGLYKPILDPTSSQFVYRILFLPGMDDLNKITNAKATEPSGAFGAGTLNPVGSKISGWTSDQGLIDSFTPPTNAAGGKVLVVFKAPVKGNAFFGKPGKIASVVDPAYSTEMETFGVGPVKYVSGAYASTENMTVDQARAAISALLKNPQAQPKGVFGALKDKVKGMFSEEPESEDEVFGKYAFDATRKDIKDPEIETPIETASKQALIAYMVRNQKGALDDKAALLLRLAQEGKYKPVLDPSKTQTAYRLMMFGKAQGESFLQQHGLDPKDLTAGDIAVVRRGGTLAPKGTIISGWAAKITPKNLDNINGLEQIGPGGVMIGFIANVADNQFFGKPGNMAKALGKGIMADEQEIIGVGPIQYHTMVVRKHGMGSKKNADALEDLVLAMLKA
jgi:hypothetical protein